MSRAIEEDSWLGVADDKTNNQHHRYDDFEL